MGLVGMPAGTAVKAAIEELRNALGVLDRAIDMRFERERDSVEMEQEIRRISTSRSSAPTGSRKSTGKSLAAS
jgi:hypothetical protein